MLDTFEDDGAIDATVRQFMISDRMRQSALKRFSHNTENVGPIISNYYNNGLSFRDIAKKLIHTGVKNLKGTEFWDHKSAKNALELYIGARVEAKNKSNSDKIRHKYEVLENTAGPIVHILRVEGCSCEEIAIELARRGISNVNGEVVWSRNSVTLLLRRYEKKIEKELNNAARCRGALSMAAKADAFACLIGPLVLSMNNDGMNFSEIATALEKRKILTSRGKQTWSFQSVKDVFCRYKKITSSAD